MFQKKKIISLGNHLFKWLRPGWRYVMFTSSVQFLLRILQIRRKTALENLAVAFPQKNASWKKRVLRKHYRHLAFSLGEYFLIVKKPARVNSYMQIDMSSNPILNTLKKQNLGAVIVTGHIGNWEMLAAWMAFQGYNLHAIVRRNENAEIEAFVEKMRSDNGLRTIDKNDSMLSVVRLLKKGAFVGILGDQFAGKEGISLPLFGKETQCYFGAASLALMAKVPLVPVTSWREAPFQHKVRISTPIYQPNQGKDQFPRKKREEAIRLLTEKSNRALEQWVYQNPEQWLWLHRRYR